MTKDSDSDAHPFNLTFYFQPNLILVNVIIFQRQVWHTDDSNEEIRKLERGGR